MKTISDIVLNLEKYDKTALVYKTGYRTFTFSYSDLYQNVLKTYTLLDTLKLQKGDTIILWGYNSPYWGMVFLAAAMKGVIVVPIDYLATSEFVEKIQRIVKAKFIFHSEYKIPPNNLPAVILDHLEIMIESIPAASVSSDLVTEEDTLEIVFTSGTTGDPKGVVLTHKNVLTNIEALKKAVHVTPDQVFLSVLPLSHLFEQNPGFLAPLSLGCTIVYIRGLKPSLIFKTLHEVNVTNIILVPRLLKLFMDGILREVETKKKTALFTKMRSLSTSKSIKKLLFRSVHSRFGTHFRYFIVGGAPLSEDLETFWNSLGFTLVQGYGLTECSPVLTANTPEIQVHGSVGKALPGVSLKTNSDGEIVAKGDNITSGYFEKQELTKNLFDKGWMKTGDMGEIQNGYLYLRGRKKDVIVTDSGMKIYPEDIEQILLKNKNVKDVCVLGVPSTNGEIIHAEILLKEKADLRTLIDTANKSLNQAQQITSYALWDKEDFPRTTTMKIQKRFVLAEIEKRKESTQKEKDTVTFSKLYHLLARIAGIEVTKIKNHSKLSLDLHMTSVHRLELVSLLEQEYNLDINEEEITHETTVKDLETIIQERKRFHEKNIFRRWLLSRVMRGTRAGYNTFLTDPIIRLFCRRTVTGKENLKNLQGPVIFISNHVGYFDTPNILLSLPFSLRSKVAPAAWKEYFEIPRHQYLRRLLYWFYYQHASLFTNIFLFPKKKGFKRSLEYTGELLDKKWNILFFPEGEHSPSGTLQPFRTGIGFLVKEMRVPIVPIKHSGLEKVMAGDAFQLPRFGKVSIKIGKPITVDYRKSIPEITDELHKIIKNM